MSVEEEGAYDSLDDKAFEDILASLTSPTEQPPVETQEQETEEPGSTNNELLDEAKGIESSNEDQEGEVETPEEESTPTEYDAMIKELFSEPIKANGKKLKIESREEAISLIQKGAGYENAMAKLKPYKKIGKTLEAKGIGEKELQMLIDAYDGDTKALKSLVEKTNTNLLDLEDEDSKTYEPKTSLVSDQQIEFDDILSDIKKSPKGSELLSIIGDFDEKSKQELVESPNKLKALLAEHEAGRLEPWLEKLNKLEALGNKQSSSSSLDYLIALAKEDATKTATKKTSKQAVDPSVSKHKAKGTPANTSSVPKQKTIKDLSLAQLDEVGDENFEKLFTTMLKGK